MSLHRSGPKSLGIPTNTILRLLQGIEKRVDSIHNLIFLRNCRIVING